jgi:hypothetical protein
MKTITNLELCGSFCMSIILGAVGFSFLAFIAGIIYLIIS